MAAPNNKKNIEDVAFIKFKKKLQRYLNSYQVKKVERAYLFAKDAHHGQKRKSGENYITHPLHAASYLADYELDHETIMAATLHDVVEDTEISLADLEKNFGKKVSGLVPVGKQLFVEQTNSNQGIFNGDLNVKYFLKYIY